MMPAPRIIVIDKLLKFRGPNSSKVANNLAYKRGSLDWFTRTTDLSGSGQTNYTRTLHSIGSSSLSRTYIFYEGGHY